MPNLDGILTLKCGEGEDEISFVKQEVNFCMRWSLPLKTLKRGQAKYLIA